MRAFGRKKEQNFWTKKSEHVRWVMPKKLGDNRALPIWCFLPRHIARCRRGRVHPEKFAKISGCSASTKNRSRTGAACAGSIGTRVGDHWSGERIMLSQIIIPLYLSALGTCHCRSLIYLDTVWIAGTRWSPKLAELVDSDLRAKEVNTSLYQSVEIHFDRSPGIQILADTCRCRRS